MSGFHTRMPAKPIEFLRIQSRAQWRKWLQKHYDSKPEIWLEFYKRHTGKSTLGYNDAVEEALCWGWIDSIVRRLDDTRYARKFTPRKADSRWSSVNRRRYADLELRGLLPNRDGSVRRRAGAVMHRGYPTLRSRRTSRRH